MPSASLEPREPGISYPYETGTTLAPRWVTFTTTEAPTTIQFSTPLAFASFVSTTTTIPPHTPYPETNSGSGGLSPATVAGIIIGSFFGAFLLVFLLVLCMRNGRTSGIPSGSSSPRSDHSPHQRRPLPSRTYTRVLAEYNSHERALRQDIRDFKRSEDPELEIEIPPTFGYIAGRGAVKKFKVKVAPLPRAGTLGGDASGINRNAH